MPACATCLCCQQRTLPHRLRALLRFILFFLFYCYGHHRDLHSFPTRRSSDLHLVADRGLALLTTVLFASHWAYVDVLFWRSNLDRKSTRLNSSHEWISYAVFCLKKKNRYPQDSTNRLR